MAKITLVLPEGLHPATQPFMPLSILYLGSWLKKKGHKVRLIDSQTQDAESLLKKHVHSSDLVGFSVMTAHVPHAIKLSDMTKDIDSDVPVLWGGIHPSILPEQTVADKSVDYCIVGEGEQAIEKLATALEKGKQINKIGGLVYKKKGKAMKNPAAKYLEMDSLSPPDWSLVDVQKYIYKQRIRDEYRKTLQLHSGRGCNYRCAFCINTIIANRWRPLGAEKIIREAEMLKDRFGIENIDFSDENLFADKKRVMKFSEALGRLDLKWIASCRVDYLSRGYYLTSDIRQLVKNGLGIIGFGMESGSQRMLDLVCKGTKPEENIRAVEICKEVGLFPSCSFIIGLPGETREDLFATISMINKISDIMGAGNYTLSGPQVYRPYPGSLLYNKAVEMGLKVPATLREWTDVSDETGFLSPRQIPWIKSPELLLAIEYYSMHMEIPWISKVQEKLCFPLCKKKLETFPCIGNSERISMYRIAEQF
ncbi:MAG: B12-binding domain-containing radical SAM protein [Candidatus Aenigmarchaeota archaeon]|nr:B12-binding domain-containing radical SAM protein [Candidatus Aenigmarchaeota archaeon]